MVEVANMKNFAPPALHNAVAMVDRCLKVRVFSRATVQLLGVSAMVITSRYVPPALSSPSSLRLYLSVPLQWYLKTARGCVGFCC